MRSTSYSTPFATTPAWCDPLDALRVAHVDERDVVAVEAPQELVVERGPLAHHPVPRLQRLCGRRIGDHVVDATAQLLHLRHVRELHHSVALFPGLRPVLALRRADRAEDPRPAVVDQVLLDRDAGSLEGEVLAAPTLPARLERREPLGIGGPVPPPVDRRRRALEHVQVPGVLRQARHALDRCCPGPDDRDPLVTQLGHSAVVVTTGVAVVPAARVERVTLERLDPGDARQLRSCGRAERHDDEARPDVVVAIGRDVPSAEILVPVDRAHPRAPDRTLVEVVVPTDALRVLEDLVDVGVLLLRRVAELLEQRQIAVRIGVALRAGIAVPVPGAAEVAAGLDDPERRDASLRQAGSSEQAAEAAADDRHVDLVDDRLAGELGVGVGVALGEARELAGHLDVLVGPVLAQALLALEPVPGPDRIGIEVETIQQVVHGEKVQGEQMPLRAGRSPGRCLWRLRRQDARHGLRRDREPLPRSDG